MQDIARDIMGLGPIEQFLDDPTVSEVMVNGSDNIYVERAGVVERTNVRFISEEHLRRVIERIVSSVGRRIDESSPMVDARLADGSRVNVIVPPLSLDGSILTIRKFATDPFTVNDLIAMGTLTDPVASVLAAAVEGGMNILVSGGTGTGKTTLLNVLSSFVPREDRIVTIEDAVELQLHQDHVIRLEARPPNTEGNGQITIRDLVRNALRMRPDRIIIGEVRGAEALDMLQAMNTGHDGSLSTVHANAPRDALSSVGDNGTDGGLRPADQSDPRADLVGAGPHHPDRAARDGSRRVSHLTEVVGMEGEIITLQDIYRYDYKSGGAAPDGCSTRVRRQTCRTKCHTARWALRRWRGVAAMKRTLCSSSSDRARRPGGTTARCRRSSAGAVGRRRGDSRDRHVREHESRDRRGQGGRQRVRRVDACRRRASVSRRSPIPVTVLTPPTTDRSLLAMQIGSIATGGDTALYDVVVAASQHFTPSATHKVLVVLSDGKDEGSLATLEEAIASGRGPARRGHQPDHRRDRPRRA